MARTRSIILALALAGCGSQAPAATSGAAPPATSTPAPAVPPEAPPAVPATPAPGGTDPAPPGAVATPSPPPPSSLALVKELVAVEPTGPLPLHRQDETVVDPAATFRVVLSARLEDARLLLLDGAGAAVPAKGTREVGATTALTLAPTSPLRPGSQYQLRVDGDRTRDLHDAAGAVHAPFTVRVLAAGTPPPPEPQPQPKKKKRGRR